MYLEKQKCLIISKGGSIYYIVHVAKDEYHEKENCDVMGKKISIFAQTTKSYFGCSYFFLSNDILELQHATF
jgi:hypothetical protein